VPAPPTARPVTAVTSGRPVSRHWGWRHLGLRPSSPCVYTDRCPTIIPESRVLPWPARKRTCPRRRVRPAGVRSPGGRSGGSAGTRCGIAARRAGRVGEGGSQGNRRDHPGSPDGAKGVMERVTAAGTADSGFVAAPVGLAPPLQFGLSFQHGDFVRPHAPCSRGRGESRPPPNSAP
jgi:hypothetical protein